jgi:hypothetical protein
MRQRPEIDRFLAISSGQRGALRVIIVSQQEKGRDPERLFHLEPTYFSANLNRPTLYILSFWSCLLKLNRPSRLKHTARQPPGGFFGVRDDGCCGR